MKHSHIICTRINQADRKQPGKNTSFTSAMDGVSVQVNLDDWDRLAVSLVDLEVTVIGPNSIKDKAAFADRCSRLAARVDYLQESLNAVEVDGNAQIGVIRSYPPSAEDGAIAYFDIEINGKTGKISLARVVQDAESGQNRAGKTVLGYRLFSRLIDDLYEAAKTF
jgi:hypothetical protein